MEIGSIIMYPSSVIPEGFLLCDGTAVSRSTYSDLFDVIGTTYGSGDGSTTFNLPDMVGNACVGSSQTYSIGSSGGEETCVLTSADIANHSHDLPQHIHTVTSSLKTPVLTHTVTQPNFTYTRLNGTAVRGSAGFKESTIITGRSNQTMSRATNMAVAAHDASACTVSGGVSDCAALTTSATGSGAAHGNMMPYLAVMYIIRYEPDVPPVLEPNMVMYGNSVMVMTAGGSYLKSRKSL